MNRYRLTEAGINVNEGITRFNGRKDLYEKFLLKFPKDCHFGLMRDAIKEKNVEAAFQEAHALKGIIGNLSMDKFYEDLFPLVELLRERRMDGVDTLLEAVEKDYQEVISAIQR